MTPEEIRAVTAALAEVHPDEETTIALQDLSRVVSVALAGDILVMIEAKERALATGDLDGLLRAKGLMRGKPAALMRPTSRELRTLITSAMRYRRGGDAQRYREMLEAQGGASS